jgi:hypothetical protein
MGMHIMISARSIAAAALVVLAGATSLGAQVAPPAPAPAVPRPAARPADVATPDAIIAALYDVISGPAGQARDWDRMRSLFAPTGRMVPVVPRAAGGFAAITMTPDDYVQRSGEMLTRFGFTERELARRTERFGNIVHAWSTYEGRFTAPGAPTADPIRGINSIQLTSDGSRWYVLSISWEAERADLKIPAEYLRPAP